MEWIERLNKAINYIEENITKEIEYEQVAKIACCLHIIFKECLLIWQMYHFLNIFVVDGCL